MLRRLYIFLHYIFIVFSLLPYAVADSKTVLLDKEFNIKIGESIQVEPEFGVIKFIKILEDSRCPTDVTCVWAGNVKTEFEIIDNNRKKTRIFLNSNMKPNKLLLRGYTIKLISVVPSKVEGVVIPAKNYRVKLRIKPAT